MGISTLSREGFYDLAGNGAPLQTHPIKVQRLPNRFFCSLAVMGDVLRNSVPTA